MCAPRSCFTRADPYHLEVSRAHCLGNPRTSHISHNFSQGGTHGKSFLHQDCYWVSQGQRLAPPANLGHHWLRYGSELGAASHSAGISAIRKDIHNLQHGSRNSLYSRVRYGKANQCLDVHIPAASGFENNMGILTMAPQRYQ